MRPMRLEPLGFLQSMNRTGNCYDNAAMERFFSTLKFECANHKEGYLRTYANTLGFVDESERITLQLTGLVGLPRKS